MKIFLAILLSLFISSSASAQYCYGGPNSILPDTQTAPGLYPSYEVQPCISDGNYVSDTLYFTDFSTFAGQAVTNLTFDSIGNLPAGLCWSSSSSTNTFAGSQHGAILISGFPTAQAGQYSLQFYIQADAGAIALPPYTDLGPLADFYYFLRVSCGSSCPVVDTINGKTTPFIPNSSCNNSLVVDITTTDAIPVCEGNSITLLAQTDTTVNYLWSTGDNSETITITPTQSQSYSVTVTDGLGNEGTASFYVEVENCNPIDVYIEPIGATSVCGGSPVTLIAVSSSQATYLWSTGATTDTITFYPTVSGYYTVTASGTSGGSGSASIYIDAQVHGPNASFTIQPTSLPDVWRLVNLTTGPVEQYQWEWGDGSLENAGDSLVSIFHVYGTSGTYTICLYAIGYSCTSEYCDTFSCAGGTRLNVVQYPAGITSAGAHQQLYYYGGAVHFAEGVTVPSTVRLYDMSGREVMAKRGFTGDSMSLGDGLSEGVYIIRVENSSYTLSGKVAMVR